MKNNKNVSKKTKNGTIIHTRDENFYGQSNYRKEGYEKSKSNYRMAVVIDSNRADELAVVKMTTKGGKLPKGSTGDYVYTKDNKNKPITESGKFVKGKKKITEKDANVVKKGLIESKKRGAESIRRLRNLKKR